MIYRPRRCAPLCRPEVGVASGPRDSSQAAVRRFVALPGDGADRRSALQAVPAILLRRQYAVRGPLGKGWRTAERGKKQMAANRRFAAGDFGGKRERGLPPFTISNAESELAAARRQRRAREFRFPSQERLGVGSPDPNPSRSGVSVRLSPHFGNPAQSAGRFVRGAHPQPPSNRTTTPNRAPLTDRSTPEVGVPSRPRAFSWSAGRGFAALSGKPRTAEPGKTNGSKPPVRCRRFRGKA